MGLFRQGAKFPRASMNDNIYQVEPLFAGAGNSAVLLHQKSLYRFMPSSAGISLAAASPFVGVGGFYSPPAREF